MVPFFAQIRRDLVIAWQHRQDLAVMLVFFLIIIALFPLAIGPRQAVLTELGLPIIWIAALLAIFAGFDRLFAQDIRDGWLDQVSLSQLGLGWYALAKAASHWLTAGLPLLVMTPIMAALLDIPMAQLPVLITALLVGSLALTLLGIIGAALAEGAPCWRVTGLAGLATSSTDFDFRCVGLKPWRRHCQPASDVAWRGTCLTAGDSPAGSRQRPWCLRDRPRPLSHVAKNPFGDIPSPLSCNSETGYTWWRCLIIWPIPRASCVLPTGFCRLWYCLR